MIQNSKAIPKFPFTPQKLFKYFIKEIFLLFGEHYSSKMECDPESLIR